VHPIPLHCHFAYGQRHGIILSGHLTTVAMPMSGQQGWHCTIVACSHILLVLMVSLDYTSCRPKLLMWDALETSEPTCKLSLSLFLRPMTRREPEDTWLRHSPPSQEDMIKSCGTRGSVRALLSGEAGSRAAGHVATLEPSLLGRQGPESWDVWQIQSPLQWKGRVRS
jgi:hypothetical protein